MPVLEQVLEQYPDKVKVVFKHYPLRNHQYAFKAATATMAAHDKGKFWEFHDRLFQNYKQISDQKIDQIAGDLGLDLAVFKKLQQSAKVQSSVRRDMQDAAAADVRGTPSVFVNGRLLKRRSLTGFKQAIDAELKRLSESR